MCFGGGQPPLRLITSGQPKPEAPADDDVPAAEVRGVNVYAKQCVDGCDRRQLERLCKYITRPPVARDRPERRSDGRLELSFKSTWKDGAVPSEIVPKPPPDATQRRPPPAPGDQLELPSTGGDDDEPPRRRRWAWLIRHLFRADVDTCRRCGGPMRWMDAAGTPQAAERLLAKLGLAPQPPPLGQLTLPFR